MAIQVCGLARIGSSVEVAQPIPSTLTLEGFILRNWIPGSGFHPWMLQEREPGTLAFGQVIQWLCGEDCPGREDSVMEGFTIWILKLGRQRMKTLKFLKRVIGILALGPGKEWWCGEVGVIRDC